MTHYTIERWIDSLDDTRARAVRELYYDMLEDERDFHDRDDRLSLAYVQAMAEFIEEGDAS